MSAPGEPAPLGRGAPVLGAGGFLKTGLNFKFKIKGGFASRFALASDLLISIAIKVGKSAFKSGSSFGRKSAGYLQRHVSTCTVSKSR